MSYIDFVIAVFLPDRVGILCPAIVPYKLVNIRMARLISLIVILYPADTILFFLTAEITAG